MLHSALSLHLPGSSPDSGRLWEALEAGAVPAVVEEFGPGEEQVGTRALYGDEAARATRGALRPLVEALGAPLPFLVVRDAAALARELRRLHAEPPLLDAMQRRTREWWEAVKEHYARQFEQAMCPPSPGDAREQRGERTTTSTAPVSS